MNTRSVADEFAKMRHLGVVPVSAVLAVGVIVGSLYTLVNGPESATDSPESWYALLAGMSFAVPMLAPLAVAVVASRQTEIEHRGSGWLHLAVTGSPPGAVCRAKIVATGLVSGGAVVLASVATLAAGRLLVGITASVPTGLWLGVTAACLVCTLVILALQVLLSAVVDNQLVCLAVGILGSILATFSAGLPATIALVTPWGYFSLTGGGDFRGGTVVAVDPVLPGVAGLAVAALLLVAAATRLLDRREV